MCITRQIHHKLIGLKHEVVITVLKTAVLIACVFISTHTNAGEKKMTELTKNMQPVCVGQFEVSIPLIARIKGWSQNIDDTEIDSITPPSQSKIAFDDKIAQNETKLISTPHKTGGVLFNKKIQLSPEATLLVHRADRHDNFLYKLDAMFWSPSVEIIFHTKTTDSYLDDGIARISKVVNIFSPMSTANLMSLPPGLCLNNGVINRAMQTGAQKAKQTTPNPILLRIIEKVTGSSLDIIVFHKVAMPSGAPSNNSKRRVDEKSDTHQKHTP